ncbi:caspase family protein [Lyngbya aestuarii]|uniref:caspase family protein n=1 Tax=Lyngbya aestuarii TaxID=118322 RepID=UPI00403E29BA
MPPIKRRRFLQFASSTLATLGLSQLNIQRQGFRYARVLGQTTPRKLALLVGINQYPQSERFVSLKGCVNDVELQRELLIHRFGFKANDILILTDNQATRQGILQGFEEHLIKQAKPGDVVVFHFSGHGSRVAEPSKVNPDQLNSTFVPADDGSLLQQGIVTDIMGRTLFLLMSALKTEHVTVVLDSCFSGGGTRGNFRVRSANGGANLQTTPAEFEYQQQWLYRLKLPKEELEKRRSIGVAKGVVIASARRNQLAIDAAFNDFYAGAFTYLLTQYLWQQTSTVENAIAQISRDLKQISFQVPLADIKPGSGNERKPVYFVNQQIPPAEAVVTQVNGNQVKLWLGGLNFSSIEAFNQGASFLIVNSDGRSSGEVKLQSRDGLIGEGTIVETATMPSLQPGTLLQESTRAIPGNLKLRIGIDPTLVNDTTVAREALATMGRFQGVPFQGTEVPYQGEIHYLLSRMIPEVIQAWRSSSSNLKEEEIPPVGSIGLLSPGRDEVLPDSFGEPGETVKDALFRLQTKLKSLLAVRIVKHTLNANSSRLNIAVAMTPENQQELIAEAFTTRDRSSIKESNRQLSQQLKLNTPFQFRVTNQESQPLYLSILVIDPTGGLTVLFPNQWHNSEEKTRLEAKQTLLIPNPELDGFQLVAGSLGIGEVLVIASQAPLKKALLTLQSLAAELRRDRGPLTPQEPVAVIGDLLDDLSTSRGTGSTTNVSQEVSASEIATLSVTFEVI